MTRKKPKATTGQLSAFLLRAIKKDVNKAGDLIENVLKPKHVGPPATGHSRTPSPP
jgi:hypothetical protein